MKTNKIISVIVLVLLFAMSANSQIRSAYYLDAYSYRHRINPAMASTRSYFIVPPIGNVEVNQSSNLGLSTFLYPMPDGRLATFMHPDVSRKEFLSKLSKNNMFDVRVDLSLISLGIRGRHGGFTTAEINIRADETVRIPKSLFEFITGNIGSQGHYDLAGTSIRSRNSLEISLGHSHRINDRLNVGAKVKFLLGVVNADATIDNLSVDMTKDVWRLQANASAFLSGPVDIATSEDGQMTVALAEQIFKPAGYGLAFDLGATYEIIDGLTVSAAVVDLGFMTWQSPKECYSENLSWEFRGKEEISLDSNSPNYIGSSFNNIFEGLEMGPIGERDTKLSPDFLTCTVNVGAEYKMPFYRKMSVGALITSNIRGKFTSTEGRFSLNLEPTNWFGFAASYGISDFGSTLGATMLFHSKGFTFFVGSDAIPLAYARVYDWVLSPRNKFNLGINFGMVFTVGKYKQI